MGAAVFELPTDGVSVNLSLIWEKGGPHHSTQHYRGVPAKEAKVKFPRSFKIQYALFYFFISSVSSHLFLPCTWFSCALLGNPFVILTVQQDSENPNKSNMWGCEKTYHSNSQIFKLIPPPSLLYGDSLLKIYWGGGGGHRQVTKVAFISSKGCSGADKCTKGIKCFSDSRLPSPIKSQSNVKRLILQPSTLSKVHVDYLLLLLNVETQPPLPQRNTTRKRVGKSWEVLSLF